nr:FHA domain-containing protein [Neobacillus sp. Marseille-Q6967]
MGKTTVEQNAKMYVVENKLTHPEAINERELHAITGDSIGSLLPVTTEKSKKGIIIKGSIEGMMSLQSYFSGLMTKKMFLNVILQMIAVVKECEENLLNVNNLMLDWEYIFLDPRTKKIKCILWPIVNNQKAIPVEEFFQEMPFRVVFTKHENHDYITQYLRYFKNNEDFSINDFEKMIVEIMGKKAEINSDSTNNSKVCSMCRKVSEESAKYCANCGNPLNQAAREVLGISEVIGINDSLEFLPREVLNISEVLGLEDTHTFREATLSGSDVMGGTTVLGVDVLEKTAFPYLIREKTQETISVNKPFYRIGKDSSDCDYLISNNNAISRNHVDIITRNRRYYIIDHHSTNKTYVDDRVIPGEKEVEIFSGTRIKLANEDFVFYQ